MRNRMIRFLSLLLCLMICFPSSAGAEENPLSIIASNFPAFDFARSLTGDTADVKLLLPPGSESHSYEPTPQDIIAIQNCDLFIYTGGESDSWIEAILSSMGADAPETFRMSDCVTLLASETTASMEHSHSHDHIHSMKQGMAPPWMAVAWVKPFFSSAFMVASDRPMSR